MQGTITDEGSRTVRSDVTTITDALAERIGPQKYKIWFMGSTRFALSGGFLKISVPNPFMAGWLESHFLKDIKQAAHSVTGTPLHVAFTIDAELSGQRRVSPSAAEASATSVGQSARPAATGPAASPKRLKLTLDSFVVGQSNELAYSAARAVIREQHSPFNPLFIHGGYGIGKTHLLQGICNGVAHARPQTNWLYLSAEEFANQFVLSLKTKKLETFRNRMRQTDLLAIDDVHFLASKPSTQEEFLHTFNTINLAGKQVVLVSDAHPKMIGQLSEKLVNRFVSGMVVKIEPPDFQTRCEICRQYARRMAATSTSGAESMRFRGLPESVVRYVAERIRTNVRELEGALLKVIAYAALQDGPVTLGVAEKVLAEHLERCDPIVHVSDIETTVAAYFGTTPTNLHSNKKSRTISLARHFSMFLTRKYTNMSSSEIGRFMGNKNHATVLMACKKIEGLLERNEQINWQGPHGNKVVRARAILAELEENVSA